MAEKKPNMSVLGSTGLRHSSGLIEEEYHPKLRGSKAIQVYRTMRDNDPIIGAMLYAIESLIRQAEWKVEPAGTGGKSVKCQKFVEECMNDMSHTWEDLLAEILTMLTYGWAYFEVVYKKREGLEKAPPSFYDDRKVGWRKIAIRAQETLERWELDDDGGIKGLWQVAPPRYQRVFLPIEKCVLFRTSAHANNPEGRSILRNAYRPWYFKQKLEEIEAIGMERDLAGLPVFEVPPSILAVDATPQEKALRSEFEKLVQQIRRDEREGVVMPSSTDESGRNTGYKLSLLSGPARNQSGIGSSIVRYEQRMAVSVLAEFLMLGMEQVGSYALASTKTTLFSTSLRAIMDTISSTFNRYVLPPLLLFNGFPQESWPELKHGDAGSPGLTEIGQFLQMMVASGIIIPDDTLQAKIREIARLPEAEEQPEEEQVPPQPVAQPGQKPPAPGQAAATGGVPATQAELPGPRIPRESGNGKPQPPKGQPSRQGQSPKAKEGTM